MLWLTHLQDKERHLIIIITIVIKIIIVNIVNISILFWLVEHRVEHMPPQPAIRSEQGKETLSRGKDGREGKGKEILSKKVMVTLQYDTRITPM